VGVWAGEARPNTHTITLNCVTSISFKLARSGQEHSPFIGVLAPTAIYWGFIATTTGQFPG